MANEPDSGSTPAKPAMKKLMYKSPLSGIRSTPYKPPVDKSGFNPIGVSSPKLENNGAGDRFALVLDGPQQGRPSPKCNFENERNPSQGLDAKPIQNVSSVIPSLVGRGGHWRGPQGNDMTPENRRGGRRRGYNSSQCSSPASEGADQWYHSPVQVNDRSNGSGFGPKSFRHNNFRNNSFGSDPNSPNSPRGQFNSSDRSHNSPHNGRRGRGNRGGNRGGNHGHKSNADITAFYSSWMSVDPWSDLMREKMNESSFQSKTLGSDSKSAVSLNVTSDSDMDEGIASQENDTPAGDDSS